MTLFCGAATKTLSPLCQSYVSWRIRVFCRLRSTVTVDSVLSDANKLRVQERLKAIKPIRDFPQTPRAKTKSKAAVLVPLCTINGEPSILFTLRSQELSSHRGQVSFPGGKSDKEDASLIETALREAHEEIGLNKNLIDVWGEMNPLPNRTSAMMITPILANCGEINLSNLSHNQDEVAATFHRTIASLCSPNNTHYTRFGSGYTLPVYTGGEQRIWGITAIILHQTLTTVAPGLYKFKLSHIA